MARAPQEYDLQKAFYQWLVGWPDKHGVPTKPPALLPGVQCWHTPNGGERRDGFEGKRLKEMGVCAGVHDLLFLWGGLYGMEWKKPNGKPAEDQRSTAQIRTHAALLAAGMVASATVDSLESARSILRRWGLVAPEC